MIFFFERVAISLKESSELILRNDSMLAGGVVNEAKNLAVRLD
jgi:hypothetical protein